jgi:DHA2 family multidrug resistance protein-like MFS transporter
MALLLILGPRVLPEYKDPNAGRLDILSVAMSVTAVLAVIYGLKQIAQDGITPLPVAGIVAGLVVGLLWVRRQFGLEDPMIDLRLFRIRAFNVALFINFLAIFVMVGYFLYVAQYLQLVAGLSPFAAGLWSLPSAIAFVVGSQIAPRISHRVRPAYLIGGGLALGAAGLAILTQVGVVGGLLPMVVGSIVISIGLAPVFGLTTELIVGSAPPERAGAASGISETGSELGGALGIAVLGSVGVAVYRGQLAQDLPASIPAGVAEAARDTLGSAVAAAAQLPAELGVIVLGAAREAFVVAMQLSSAFAAVVAFGLAVMTAIALRAHVLPSGEPTGEETTPEPDPGHEPSPQTVVQSLAATD